MTTIPMREFVTIVSLITLATSCKSSAQDVASTAGTNVAAPSASSATNAAVSAALPSASATAVASVAPSARPAGSAAPIARSNVPTVAEWKQATKLSVNGGAWLGCVAEGVREWVRVSCRQPSLAGVPRGVRVTSGAGPDVLTYQVDPDEWLRKGKPAPASDPHESGTTSVQFRFVPGTEIHALFGWEMNDSEVIPLTVRWPAGVVDRPDPVGAFEGIPATLEESQHQAMCGCFWTMAETYKAMGRYDGGTQQPSSKDSCVGIPDHFLRFQCLLHFSGCEQLAHCDSTGSPGVYVECLPGEDYVGAFPTGQCARKCEKEVDCPELFECAPGASMGHPEQSFCSVKHFQP